MQGKALHLVDNFSIRLSNKQNMHSVLILQYKSTQYTNSYDVPYLFHIEYNPKFKKTNER